MNVKKTLFLAAVLLVAVLYMRESLLPAHQKKLAGLHALDDSFTEEQLIRLTISKLSNGAVERFSLESKGKKIVNGAFKGWELAGLPGSVLDLTAVSSFFQSFKGLKLSEPIPDSQLNTDFSEYGLDKPNLTISAERATQGSAESSVSASSVSVSFGKKNEYLSQRYVKVSGYPSVYLVDDSSYQALNKSQKDLRSATPIQFLDADVRTIELTSSAGVATLKQPAAGEWKTIADKEYAASVSEVGALLQGVKDLRASEFLDSANVLDPAFGLKEPTAKITITFHDTHVPKELVVKVGKAPEKEGASYFTYSGAPSVFKTVNDFSSVMVKPADSFRDRRIFAFSVDAVKQLKVTSESAPEVDLLSEGIEWKVNGKSGDAVFIEGVIENLLNLEVDMFKVQDLDTGLDKPSRLFVLTRKDPLMPALTLKIGKLVPNSKEPSYFAKLGDDGELFTIRVDALKKAIPREETLLEATPIPSPAPSPISQ